MTTDSIAAVLAAIIEGWLVLGLVFAGPLVFAGLGVIDPRTRGAGWGFRLIVIPGVVLLWPLLLWRWISGRSGRSAREHNAHLDAAGSKR